MSSHDWIPFINNTGSTVPPFSCLVIDPDNPIVTVDSIRYLRLNKSTAYGAQFSHYFTGPFPVAVQGYGRCTNRFPCVAAVSSSSTPATGTAMGPTPGTMSLQGGSGGFRTIGVTFTAPGISGNLVLVNHDPWLTTLANAPASTGNPGQITNTFLPCLASGVPLNDDSGNQIGLSTYNPFVGVPPGQAAMLGWLPTGWNVIDSQRIYYGKTVGSILKGGSGLVKIYRGTPGSETLTSFSANCLNRFANIGSGIGVHFECVPGGFVIVNADIC